MRVEVTSKFRTQQKNAIASCLCFNTSRSLVGLWNHTRSILLPICDLHLFMIPIMNVKCETNSIEMVLMAGMLPCIVSNKFCDVLTYIENHTLRSLTT